MSCLNENEQGFTGLDYVCLFVSDHLQGLILPDQNCSEVIESDQK